MLITNVQLPVCDHCAKMPLIEKLPGPLENGQATTVFFVLCQSDTCSVRKDNGLRTIGRVLTDGKPNQNAAEEAWRAYSRTGIYRDQLAQAGS